MTEQQPEQTLEERFVSLRRAARDIECDLHVSLTVGGVRFAEVYKIYETDDPDVSLSESLDKIDEQVHDVRVLALAQATKRLIMSEQTAEIINLLVKQRGDEYRIARDAMRQAFQHKNRPEDLDTTQTVMHEIVLMDREAPFPDDLVAIIAEAYARTQQNQTLKQRVDQAEQPDSGA